MLATKGMQDYPVHYQIEFPDRCTRLQLFARLVAFIALGIVGLSFGTVFLVAYLALPVLAASRIAAGVAPADYVANDGRRVVGALRWFAAVSAWFALIAEHLPARSPSETVQIDLRAQPRPTPGSAMSRVITGLPSALVLMLLCAIGCFVWLWAAIAILITERVPHAAFDYLVGLQRWSIRLLAYQASLVDDYPPFSFSESAPLLPTARVAP